MSRLKIGVFLVVHFVIVGLCQAQNGIDSKELFEEIGWYINKTKPDISQDGLNDVFLVKIHKETSEGYCMTLGIASDSVHFSYLRGYDYYKLIDGRLVLFNFSNKTSYKSLELTLVENPKIIFERFIPDVVFSTHYPGYVCCYKEGNIVRILYKNSDQIPQDKKIFQYIPIGTTIRVDSSEMKKMLKKHK